MNVTAAVAVEHLEHRTLLAATYYVSVRGDDTNPGTDPAAPWRHIQKAFDAATPGSTVNVLAGRYNEKLVLNVSGNETDGYITFQASGKAIISGKRIPGADIISINNRRWVRIVGFDIRDNVKVNNGSGIRLTEANDHVEILRNRIHNMSGVSAMGITVYGTDPVLGISNLVIDGNEVYKCKAAPSEALVVNGNVHEFQITTNYVHDINNIGIDVIGGEGRSPDPATDVPRNGLVAGNRVTKVRFNGGGRDAAGIFVDGASDIAVERNVSWRNDVGIEVNAIHPAVVARRVTVRNNIVANNNRAGISLGGSDLNTGTVQDSAVTNNTVYQNDAKRTGNGEIHVLFASNNVIQNNAVWSRRGGLLVNSEPVAGGNSMDYNLFYSPGGARGARFAWERRAAAGLEAFRAASQQELHSVFANPLFNRPSRLDFHLKSGSPAINSGNPAFAPAAGEVDLDNQPRILGGRVDAGADEAA
jgi:hypothetical protein